MLFVFAPVSGPLRRAIACALLVLGMLWQPLLAATGCCDAGPPCCAAVQDAGPCSVSQCVPPALHAAGSPGEMAASGREGLGAVPVLRVVGRQRDIWRPPQA